LGRSRGGLSTKIHVAVDAHGQPVELRPGPGQEHDVLRGEELPASHEPKYVIADQGYDSDALIETIAAHGAKAVIPPRSNRNEKRHYSKRRYKARNWVERFFNRLKHYRRIATRYETTARHYLTFVNLAATLVSLRVTVNTT
jgi:transposase